MSTDTGIMKIIVKHTKDSILTWATNKLFQIKQKCMTFFIWTCWESIIRTNATWQINYKFCKRIVFSKYVHLKIQFSINLNPCIISWYIYINQKILYCTRLHQLCVPVLSIYIFYSSNHEIYKCKHLEEYVFTTYGILQIFQSINCWKLSHGFTKHSSSYFSFNKHCKAFIQPEVVKIHIRHQVPCPAVWNFMSHNTCQRTVTCLLKKKLIWK